jgi:hypothetical protein
MGQRAHNLRHAYCSAEHAQVRAGEPHLLLAFSKPAYLQPSGCLFELNTKKGLHSHREGPLPLVRLEFEARSGGT